jgi:hypothetical protein
MPTPSGIAKRVRQNAELARRASLKVLAMIQFFDPESALDRKNHREGALSWHCDGFISDLKFGAEHHIQ